MKNDVRRNMIRTGIAVFWVAAAIALFLNFRGHTILVDNKASPDGAAAAVPLMKVSIDAGKAVEFFAGDRDRFAVVGSSHRIRIDFADGRASVERRFRHPIGIDVFLLSVPKLLAGIEPFIEPFIAEAAVSRDDDEPVTASFGGNEPAAPPVPTVPSAP